MKYIRLQNKDFLMVLPHVGVVAADEAVITLARLAHPELNRAKVCILQTENRPELYVSYGKLFRRGPDL